MYNLSPKLVPAYNVNSDATSRGSHLGWSADGCTSSDGAWPAGSTHRPQESRLWSGQQTNQALASFYVFIQPAPEEKCIQGNTNQQCLITVFFASSYLIQGELILCRKSICLQNWISNNFLTLSCIQVLQAPPWLFPLEEDNVPERHWAFWQPFWRPTTPYGNLGVYVLITLTSILILFPSMWTGIRSLPNFIHKIYASDIWISLVIDLFPVHWLQDWRVTGEILATWGLCSLEWLFLLYFLREWRRTARERMALIFQRRDPQW